MSKRNRGHQKRRSFKLKHKKRSKKAVKLKYEEPDEFTRAPHSFVIHRGKVGKYILELEKDFRRVMEPFTASSLQVLKKNTIKDFVNVSSALKVSHIVSFTSSVIGPYMRIARLPQGPTLMFRIHNYSLGRDVISSLKKQMTNKKLFSHSPLVILNNFVGNGFHITLMASVFQNMFPTINVTKVKLSDIRRCVMLNYNTQTNMIDFRHYAIKVVPVGISKSVKKIVQSQIPNLSKYEDIADFMIKPSIASDSEAEDDPNSHVEVSQKLASRGNIVSQQSSIRLSELGPRMTLQLLKVEEGMMNGEVLFHELMHKTEEEKNLIRKRLAEKKRLKEERKRLQNENIKKKEEMKELHKQKSLAGIKRKMKQVSIEELDQVEDDDVQYYRDEVGEDPDKEIFAASSTSKPKKVYGFRKRKLMDGENPKRMKANSFKKMDENEDEKRKMRKKNSEVRGLIKRKKLKFKKPSKMLHKVRRHVPSKSKSKCDRESKKRK